MKKLIFLLLVLFVSGNALAQESVEFHYGCISYDKVLKAMPEYARAESDLAELKAKYDKEMKASEEEFNAKYSTFLSERDSYAPSILRKRQSELEDMMKRNEQFRLESLRLLENARNDMMQPVKAKLDAAIKQVAEKYQLAFVLNTDSDAVPYLNATMAYNITNTVVASFIKTYTDK